MIIGICYPFHLISLLLPTDRPILHVQGKEVNLFQPAREFLPLIDEVCDFLLFIKSMQEKLSKHDQ